MIVFGFSFPVQDTTIYDRTVRGRPFNLEEILNKNELTAESPRQNSVPVWAQTGELATDTVYYGIGKSSVSQDEADNDARLRFAQYVEVSVQSIAVQQIAENKDRLVENYNYESLVSTNMNLRSIKISQRYMLEDSTFYSLISYGKSEYHALVTREIQVSLEADIRKQELTHQAKEALSADSLRHKLKMDSLALGRKQAVIDSLDHVLQMEESRQRQEQERINLIKSRHVSFLKIKPRYQLIDVPSAGVPDSWIYLSGRWNPDTEDIRQLKAGLSLGLLNAEANVWATRSLVDQGDLSLKLQVLPARGEIYSVSLAFGWIAYLEAFPERINYREGPVLAELIDIVIQELGTADGDLSQTSKSTFFVTSTVGLPQINHHLSFFMDKRRISLASIWYPFPRNMGDAISILNQVDFIRSSLYRNRFDDAVQWQMGLRLIAIPDRFATMISYEDHEVWMLNFEFGL